MTKQIDLGGSFTLPGTSMSVNRMGYGAMQLAGPQVYGPPRDMDAAIAVLREAVAAGGNHIPTTDFFCAPLRHQTNNTPVHPLTDGPVMLVQVECRSSN